jgi:hypothetical protein
MKKDNSSVASGITFLPNFIIIPQLAQSILGGSYKWYNKLAKVACLRVGEATACGTLKRLAYVYDGAKYYTFYRNLSHVQYSRNI